MKETMVWEIRSTDGLRMEPKKRTNEEKNIKLFKHNKIFFTGLKRSYSEK